MKTNLVVDANNILYRSFHGAMEEDVMTTVSRCHQSALISMQYLFKKYKASDIILAFDDGSWRKVHTAPENEDRVTHLKYKGGRRKNKTDDELARLAIFDQHVKEFYKMMKEHSNICCVRSKFIEADDIIAVFIQDRPHEKHIILSRDNDYLQLLRQPNVFIIDPQTEKEKTLQEWDYDADFFITEKCIRGEGKEKDNVLSSYPRLRSSKIKEAMTDPYKFNEIMQHEFEVEFINEETGLFEKKKYLTSDVFKENQLLMDLRMQPEGIREITRNAIDEALNNRGKYYRHEFLRYCGKYGLEDVAKDLDRYVPLLTGKLMN